MGDSSYELLSMGLRYWFVLLLFLTLLRAVYLMLVERREYKKALRRLPDAGLVGEVVDLDTGKSQPLPREGLLGSGRFCDLKFKGLHRREMEFVFRSGLGLKLIPIHRGSQAILDGEPLNKADSFALHGTVLQLRGHTLRFRLFAGLDLPYREALPDEAFLRTDDSGFGEGSPWEIEPGLYARPSRPQPLDSLDPGWQYAVPETYLNPSPAVPPPPGETLDEAPEVSLWGDEHEQP